MAGQIPSFKTDIHRNKTRKWLEAPHNDYGGDDWGIADEYNEYGTYDDDHVNEPPQAAPAPQPPTGFRHHGQTASIGSARGRASHESFRAQPTLPTLQRTNSFEAGDEGRTFSAVNSPAIAQGEAIKRLPSRHFEQQNQPSPRQQDHSSESYHTTHSRQHSASSTTRRQPESFQQHMSPRFQVQHTEPSHEPEYDDRDYSDRDQSGLGISSGHNQDQRHSYLPPLRSEIEQDPYHYGAASHQTRLPQYPPRKSSLSSRSRPDLHDVYQAHQSNESLPGPMPSHYGPSFGTGDRREDEAIEQEEDEETSQAAPRFIRPADIYKRMAEEKEKERRASDASRASKRSPERPDAQFAAEPREQEPSLKKQASLPQEKLSSGTYGVDTPPTNTTLRMSRSHEAPEVSVNQSKQTSPTFNASPIASFAPNAAPAQQSHGRESSLSGFTVSNPILARALGADAQGGLQPAQTSVTTDPSPVLPSIGRFSGFGDFADGLWQNQSTGLGDDTADLAPQRQSLDRASNRSHSPPKPQPLNLSQAPNRIEPYSPDRNAVGQAPDVSQVNSATYQNPALHAPGLAATHSDSPLSSPTAYYFSDQAGSMDYRLYGNQEDEHPISNQVQPSQDSHKEGANLIGAHARSASSHRPVNAAESRSQAHSLQASAEVAGTQPLPEPVQAISHAELEDENSERHPSSVDHNYDQEERRASQGRQSHILHDHATTSISEHPSIPGDSVENPQLRAQLEAPADLPQPARPLSHRETGTDLATDDVRGITDVPQASLQAPAVTHARNPLHLAISHEDLRMVSNTDRVNSIRDEQTDDYSPSIYTPQSAKPDLGTREADLAAAISNRPVDRSSELAQSARTAPTNFLSTRQPTMPLQSRFLQEPQPDPISRTASPGGRVKQLADKFDEIHTLSRQSTLQSPSGSASGKRERAGTHGSDDLGNTSSLRSNRDFERPRLPGEWISYADTVESGNNSDNDGDDEEDEEVQGGRFVDDEGEVPTPTGERAESPIDFSPTMKRRSSHGANDTEEAEGPMAALAAAGHALASSLQSMVGINTDEADRGDTDSETTDSVLPTPDITPGVDNRFSASFQPQPSSLSREVPVSSVEGTQQSHQTLGHNDNRSHDDDEELNYERRSIEAPAHFEHAIVKSSIDPTHRTENPVHQNEDNDYDNSYNGHGSDRSEDEPVASPAPLRPHSHVPRINTETVPQRPLWPSQQSTLSINYSPEDTESDQLRKDIIKSLSPAANSGRVSLDVESNPRSSTEYPQFNAISTSTPEKRLASTALHLSPPPALTGSGRPAQNIDSGGASLPKTNAPTAEPVQPTGVTRESSLLPQIYDSYWANRDSQDMNHHEDGDVSDRPISQTISALSSVRETGTPVSGIVTQPAHRLVDEGTKSRNESPSRPNYLAKRFSWEGEDDETPVVTVADPKPPHLRESIEIASDEPAEMNETRPHAVVDDVQQSDVAEQTEGLRNTLANVPSAAPLQATSEATQTFQVIPPVPDNSMVSPRSPGAESASASPAQYKYERPFQRTPSESTSTRTGLRTTSNTAVPPHLSARNRTISSGQFSLPGETSLSGFKTLVAIRDTTERIAAFDRTREGFANLDTGLNQWLTYMIHANPELLDDTDGRTRPSGTTGFAGSMRHKLAPSISKLTKTSDNASSANLPESPAPTMGTRSPSSMTRRTPSTSDAGPSKGKAFLQSAGQGAKGLFAKSKNKMRGASGPQKIKTPLPIVHQRAQETSPQSRAPAPNFVEPRQDVAASRSTSSPLAVHEHQQAEPASSASSAAIPPTIRPDITQPERTDTPMSAISETGLDMHEIRGTAPPMSTVPPSKPQFVSSNEQHAVETALPSTKREFWDALTESIAQARPKDQQEVPSVLPLSQPDVRRAVMQDNVVQPISPLQSLPPSSRLSREVTHTDNMASEDYPISPISPISSTNFLPFPTPSTLPQTEPVLPNLSRTSSPNAIRPVSTEAVTDQGQAPRRSLALEKQQSVTVNEMEIHPALLERQESTRSVNRNDSGVMETSSRDGVEQRPQDQSQNIRRPGQGRRRGSSVGPKPPMNVDRLPPKVRQRYESYGSDGYRRSLPESDKAVPAVPPLPATLPAANTNAQKLPDTPPTRTSADGGRRRSKSPFARFRNRSKTRNTQNTHERRSSTARDLDTITTTTASTVATANAALTRSATTPNPVQDQTKSPSTSNKRNKSPFRFHFRARSTSRPRTAQSRSEVVLGQDTTGATDNQRAVELNQSQSNAIPDAISPQRGRPQSRERTKLRKKSISDFILPHSSSTPQARSHPTENNKDKRNSWYSNFSSTAAQTQAPTAESNKEKRSSWYGSFSRPTMPESGGSESNKRRSWYGRNSSVDVLTRKGSNMSLGGGGRDEMAGKRRSWYEGLLCHDEGAREAVQQGDGVGESTEVERNVIPRHAGPMQVDGTTPVQEAERRARSVSRLRNAGRDASQGARQRMSFPQETGSVVPVSTARERDGEGDAAGPSSAHSQSPIASRSLSNHNAEELRSVSDPGRGIYDPHYSPTLLQQSTSQYPPLRPWATPNHSRQNPAYLEHKQRRLEQGLQQQQVAQAQSPRVEEVAPPTSSDGTQARPMSAHTHQQQHGQASTTSQAQSQSHPHTEPRQRSDTTTSLPRAASVSGLPTYLSHLTLNLSPPTSPTAEAMTGIRSTDPASPPTASSPTKTRASHRPRKASLAGSLATSINVNVGHHGDDDGEVPVPPLPASVLIATMPSYDPMTYAKEEREAQDNARKAAKQRVKRNSGGLGDGAIAAWRDGVVSAGPEEAVPPQWPLVDDAVPGHGSGLRGSGLAQQPAKAGIGQAEDSHRKRGCEQEQEDVVMSPTLDGPGWEWQPDM